MIRANDNSGKSPDPSPMGGYPTSTALIPASQGIVPARMPHAEQETTAKIRAVLGAFRRRWFLAIFLGLTCGAGAAALAWAVLPAPYTAFSELRISSVQNRILFKTAEERANFNTWKQTQIKLATTREVLNAALRNPEVAQLKLIQSQPHPIHWLEQELSVGAAGTEFIRISLSGDEPAELAAIVNSVTDAYMTEVVTEDDKKRKARLSTLQKIYSEVEEQLRTKKRQLRSFSESLQAGNTEQANQRQRYLLELSIQMRKELADVHMQLMASQLHWGDGENEEHDADAAKGRIPEFLVDEHVNQEPEVRKLTTQIAQLESHYVQYKQTVAANHPKLIELQDQLAQQKQRLDELRVSLRPSIRENLATQLNADVAAREAAADLRSRRQSRYLEARKRQLEEELASVKTIEERTGILTFEQEALAGQVEQSESIAHQISSEIEKLKIELESPMAIGISRRADVPLFRNQKKKVGGTALAGLGVFACFVGGIVWLEMRLRRINQMDEVVDDLALRVLGTVPVMPRSASRRGNGRAQAKRAFWESVLTESIDSTRTMLLRNAEVDSLKCVMIASAMGNEGKTTLSCHLATSIARAGRKVVLVDCDLRRPSVQQVFDVPPTPGMCELLRGEVELADTLHTAGPEGLWVLPAGKVCPVALQELAQDRLESLLNELQSQFDFVIVDTSPILPVTDALLVAQHVDGVVMSIRRDVSRSAKVMSACQRISLLGVPILGAVVIGLDEGVYGTGYPYRYGYAAVPAEPAHAAN